MGIFQTLGDVATGGLFGLASGALGMAQSAMNYNQQVKLMKLQNQFNVEQWERNNEYNTPTAQLQRYQEAGLNANLIYGGSGAVAGNSSSPVTSANLSGVEKYKGIQEAINMALNFRMQNAQVKQMELQNKNLAEQNALIKAQTATEGAKASNLNSQSSLNNTKYRLALATYDNDVEQSKLALQATRANINYLNSGVSVNNARVTNYSYQNDLLSVKKDEVNANIKRIQALTNLSYVEAQNLYSLMAFRASQKALVEAQTQGQINVNGREWLYRAHMNQENLNLMEAFKGKRLDNFSRDLKNYFLFNFGKEDPGSALMGAGVLARGLETQLGGYNPDYGNGMMYLYPRQF